MFADCHDNPVDGHEVLGYNLDDCITGAGCNCEFVADESDIQVYTRSTDIIAMHCSADDDDIETAIDAQLVDIWWEDGVVGKVVCDFYMADDSLPLAHAGESGDADAAPNTGAGSILDGANVALTLAGAVALGGLAVASRRNAFR